MARPPRLARLLRGLAAAPQGGRRARAQAASGTRSTRSTRRTPRSPGDGPPIFFFNDEAATIESLRRHSPRDAEAYPKFQRMMERIAEFLRPMMLRPPPALGSRHPGDLLSLLREAGRAAGLSRRDLHDFYRVMTMSVGDLLDDWFEHDALQGRVRLDRRGRRVGRAAHAGHGLQPAPPRARRDRRRAGTVGARQGRDGRDLDVDRAQRRGRRRDDPHGRVGAVDRRGGRSHHRGHARYRRAAARAGRHVGRAPEDHRARHGRRPALPRRGGRGHAPLQDARRLGQGQLGAL